MQFPHQSRYTVRKGDTLEKIALTQYGTRSVWREIARTNHIRRDRILVGMKLRLPMLGAHSGSVPASLRQIPTQAPQPAPPPAPAPPGHDSPSNRIRHPNLVGDIPAVPVGFPAIKLTQSVPIAAVVTPLYTITGEVEFECALQREGTMTELEIADEGITLSGALTSDYQNALNKFTSETKVAWDITDPEKGLSLSANFTVWNKIGGQPFVSTSVQMIGPNVFQYTMSPREVEAETPDKDFILKGKVSYKITVKLNDQRRTEPQLAPVPARAYRPRALSQSDWVAIGVVCTLGVVLIAVTVVAPPAGAIGWAELAEFLGLGSLRVLAR